MAIRIARALYSGLVATVNGTLCSRAVPRSLLMTFFGAFLRRLGGWIAVADLVALMADLDLDEQAVRSAVSRLKRRGVIAPERRGGAAGYRLTAHGEDVLAAGDARIFGRDGSGRAGEWLVVVFSIPEARRALRHRLRTRLQWLGLGTVAAGVWIAPAPAEAEVRRVVADLGLGDHVELFRGRHLGGGEPVAQWWDLDGIAAEYRAYVAAWEPALDRASRPPAQAFADHVRQLDAWRRIPFHDPGLPAAALPEDWPGAHAWAVFRALDRRLRGPARRHVAARVSGANATVQSA
jgi:phenylacetic acid degradation operon negative regulatory protein